MALFVDEPCTRHVGQPVTAHEPQRVPVLFAFAVHHTELVQHRLGLPMDGHGPDADPIPKGQAESMRRAVARLEDEGLVETRTGYAGRLLREEGHARIQCRGDGCWVCPLVGPPEPLIEGGTILVHRGFRYHAVRALWVRCVLTDEEREVEAGVKAERERRYRERLGALAR